MENVAIMRRIYGQFLSEMRVPMSIIADMVLVLGELASNVVRHARSARGVFRVYAVAEHEVLTLVVRDWGRGMDWQVASQAPGTLRPDASAEDGMREGGWGLPLVRNLTDHFTILPSPDDGPGICVRVAKFL